MIRAYIYKSVRSPLLYIGILGVMAMCCTTFLTYDFFYGNVVNRVKLFLYGGIYRKAVAVFAALPFTANFADEWKSGVAVNCITRKGIKKYAASNVLFCVVTTTLTAFVGMMLFSLLYSLFIPMFIYDGNPDTFLFGQFLENGHGEIYLTLRIFVFSVSCSAWAMTGMLLSSLLPNKYVAICAPFVASYVVERITMQLPDYLNLWYVSLSAFSFDSDIVGFIYCVGVFTVISAACGIIFYSFVRKRVQNEIA